MLKVKLIGHDRKTEISSFLKTFYSREKIEFVHETSSSDKQNLYIENGVYSNNNIIKIETRIFKDDKCISSNVIENIDVIDIKEDNIKRKTAIGIKQSLFEAISKITDVDVPWGVLVGIRPTKIVHRLIDDGYKEEEIREVLLREYKLSKEKTNLIIKIAYGERKFLYSIDEDNFSLYISIPFCPSRCLYCSFPSNAVKEWGHLIDAYTDKLIYEIEELAEIMKHKKIETVYIGGGTPTAIPVKNLDNIIKKVYQCFGKENIKEFTVEAGRPDTIDRDMLLMFKENDIERISINPQSMHEPTLSVIGRNHSTEDIINAYELAKEIGFEVINMDLIVGLPGEGIEEVNYTMEAIKKLKPDNLTVHTMAVKKSSRLKDTIDQYKLAEQSDISKMLDITKEYAEDMNMYPYYMYRQKNILGNFENVGYTTKDKECIYNILIIEERQTIMAVGAGGVSKFYYPEEQRIERVPNVKNLVEYIKRTDEMIERKRKYVEFIDRV